MRPKTAILLMVAIGCGLVAALMVSRMMATQPQAETIKLLVAVKDTKLGTTIQDPDKNFKWVDWPKKNIPPQVVDKMDKLKGKTTKTFIGEGQPVTFKHLHTKDQLEIPKDAKGKYLVAQAIRVNAASVAGGFVLPGTHVNVNSTTTTKGGKQTTALLQNKEVLAVDMMKERPEDRPAYVGSTVTLAVTPEDSLILSLYQTLGPLDLVLRNKEDDKQHDLGVQKLGGPRPTARPSAEPTVVVLVAKSDLPVGTSVEKKEDFERLFRPMKVLKTDVPPGGITPDEARTLLWEKKLNNALRAGQFVFAKDFGKGLVAKSSPPPPPAYHRMTVMNGPRVTFAVYKQGVLMTEPDLGMAPARDPMPPAAAAAPPPKKEPAMTGPEDDDTPVDPDNPDGDADKAERGAEPSEGK